MFLKGLKRLFGLLTGDTQVLRAELRARDPDFRYNEDSLELIRMREQARTWGIGPMDHAYPDLQYVQGEPPTSES